MNLLEERIGSTFWTADGKHRARLERRRGVTGVFELSMFDMDGRNIGTRSYHENGVPVFGNIYDKKLVKTQPTQDVENYAPPIQTKCPEDSTCTDAGCPHHYANHGVAATAGHLASNGGLRGHSVGDVFPWVPFFKGPFYNQWVRSPDGLEHGPFDTVDEMVKFIEFYNNQPEFDSGMTLYVYDYENYDDAYEARDCKALYETPSTVDAIDVDHRNGIYDVQEIVQTIERCLGRKLEAGVFDNKGKFFTLQELIDYSVQQEGK